MAESIPALLYRSDDLMGPPEISAEAETSFTSVALVSDDGDLRNLHEIEHEVIRHAIDNCGGHLTEIARRLRISRSTLYRKLDEMGCTPRAARSLDHGPHGTYPRRIAGSRWWRPPNGEAPTGDHCRKHLRRA